MPEALCNVSGPITFHCVNDTVPITSQTGFSVWNTLAVVVGKTVVGGVKCDHLLFSRPGVDFQVWIAEDKRPFPRRYVVTETDTPALLSISTDLSDWKTDVAVDDAQFNFVPPKGTSAIPFLLRNAAGVPGR